MNAVIWVTWLLITGAIAWGVEGYWWVFANPLPLFFVLFYVATSIVLTRGAQGFSALIRSFRILWRQPQTSHGVPTQFAAILSKTIRMTYGAGVAGFVIGAIAIQFFAAQSEAPANFRGAYSVNALSVWYALLLVQLFLRPAQRRWAQLHSYSA